MASSAPRSRRRLGGLRTQLLVGLVLLTLIALSLITLAADQFHQRHLYQSAADDARRHVQLLAALPDDDQRQALAHQLRADDAIADAGPAPDLGLRADADAPSLWIDDDHHPPRLVATAPTADPEPPLALVRHLDDVRGAVADARRGLALFFVSILLFITLVGYGVYSFIVIRPLRALGVATQRAAAGDLATPVEVLPANEFGDVGHQFNQMLQRLDDQRHELERQLKATQRANEDLTRAQRSLVRSEKMASVGHLAAGIAHEVGNPLAAVMGYTELLQDPDLSDDERRDLARRSLDQLQRIRSIIRQLLDYSRADAPDEPRAVDLAPLIEEAVHLVSATGRGAHTTMDLAIDEDLPPVRAVAGELEQVLVNLLLNAVEAMADADLDDPRLRLAAHVDDDHLVIDLIDQGPGVDEELVDQIFDPFFTTRPPGEGTGLGLAIAHRLVDRVQGTLALKPSHEDRGAHFQIRLPIADDDPDDPPGD